ncbi:unnamed protein product [marine sediment metagenome]|uniref:Uncharacterized protein n=1 Tax=marine sediment metagenome TaxID=412755 RepID=X0ZWP5_9ZZZZ
MRCFTVFSFLALFAVASASAQQNPNQKIWYSSKQECMVSRDTIGISSNDQNLVVIRYRFEDRDSMDCFVITSLPDVESLRGSDFFHNFVASFLIRSLLWAHDVVKLLERRAFQRDTDKVWADVEGVMREVEPNLDPQRIIERHSRYAKDYKNYYDNALMDSLLIHHANYERRAGDGWLHFVVRVKK